MGEVIYPGTDEELDADAAAVGREARRLYALMSPVGVPLWAELDRQAKRVWRRKAAEVLRSPKSVFEQLDIVMSREEWAAMCKRHGSDMPYPFADVIPFPPNPSPP